MMVLYNVYLIIGAVSFVAIENYNVNRNLTDFETIFGIVNVLKYHNHTIYEILFNMRSMHQQLFKSVRTDASSLYLQHFGAVFFSLTLTTTIGYGNVIPTTTWGQFICMLYAILGIPLNLVLMQLIGLKFRLMLRDLMENARINNIRPKLAQIMATLYFFVPWTIFFIVLPSMVFMYTEHWSFVEGIYYGIITLATIGLGDYVIGGSTHHAKGGYYVTYVLYFFVWLIFGLAYVSISLNLLSYAMGVVLLKKLNLIYKKRPVIRTFFPRLQNIIEELNWQLAKHTPEGFDKSRFLELNIMLEMNPHGITVETLQEVVKAANALKRRIRDETRDPHCGTLRTNMGVLSGSATMEDIDRLTLPSPSDHDEQVS